MGKTVKVSGINATGRNTKFKDVKTGNIMTLARFVREIEKGNYPDYHVRILNRVKTPCSNPDKSKKNNNLG